MPQPRRMRDASGLGSRLAGDLEPGFLDLNDQVAGEASLDTERALDPLPRLGHDGLVEPQASRFIQRPYRDDGPVVGYLEVAHVRVPSRLNASTPRPRQARGPSGC